MIQMILIMGRTYMVTMMSNWKGSVDIDGTHYDTITDAIHAFKPHDDNIHIVLHSNTKRANMSENHVIESESDEVTIKVKTYMTKKATADFDFMSRWNNDIPMPMRVMRGKQIKETRGMAYYSLHGFAKKTINCICCGKELTNPISRAYGIGPICLSKIGIHRDIDDVDNIIEDLEEITWDGWIIKSAIEYIEEE